MNTMNRLNVLVRKDLSQSQQTVQTAHAVAEWLLLSSEPLVWRNNTLIVYAVKDLDELEAWHEKLPGSVPFYEPDIGDKMTALAWAGGRLELELA